MRQAAVADVEIGTVEIGQWNQAGHRHALDSRRRAQAGEHPVVVTQFCFRFLIPRAVHERLERQQVMRVEARIDVHQTDKTLAQQSRADGQHER